jgi:anoctamin-1
MVGKQTANALWEMGSPVFKRLYKRWRYRKDDSVETMYVPQWEDDFLLANWGPTSLFYEYLEMVIQFGFVTIFVSAFPLAPLFALINNIFEIRLDAKKIISAFKRPVAQRFQLFEYKSRPVFNPLFCFPLCLIIE